MIQRILRSMQVSRRNAEMLYQAYVRGYLNYGMHIWSTRTSAKTIIAADNSGLRTICGLIPRTSNVNLY